MLDDNNSVNNTNNAIVDNSTTFKKPQDILPKPIPHNNINNNNQSINDI